MAKRPDDIARELGLDFSVQPSHDKRWLRFEFKFPEYTGNFKNTVNVGAKPSAADIEAAKKRAESPEGQRFADVVRRVTLWRKKVKAWLFDPQPPGEQGVIV